MLDATEGGERTLPAPLDPERLQADPFDELMRVYFDSIPDVFRRPNDRLYDWLRQRIAERGVRGLIVRRHVWCDLWHAELPRLRQEMSLPLLDLDIAAGDGGVMAAARGPSGSLPGNAAMSDSAQRITFDQWERRYESLKAGGLREPAYGGPLRRHLDHGDRRLDKLRMDNSPAALRLWNFLCSEEDRLRQARAEGKHLVGAMKDLGTIPVMAYSLDNAVAFYADGAWWLPCLMENQTGMLELADQLGIDESFCPVRAMLGAFVSGAHFPLPELVTCSVGATCDDLAAIAQRLAGLWRSREKGTVPGKQERGQSPFPATSSAEQAIFWWEMPHRRPPEPGEPAVTLPGGFRAPQRQVDFVRGELERVRQALQALTGQTLDDPRLAAGIARANRVRGRCWASFAGCATRPPPARCRRWRCSSPRCWRSISAPIRPRPPPCWKSCWPKCRPASGPATACWIARPRGCSGSIPWPICG